MLADGAELKCLACGRSYGSEAMVAEQARVEVELALASSWADYVASRRASLKDRTGKSSPESIAEYKRRYHEAHRDKDLSDMLRWKRNNMAHLKDYRYGYRARKKGKAVNVRSSERINSRAV